jgi:hypothetical protein
MNKIKILFVVLGMCLLGSCSQKGLELDFLHSKDMTEAQVKQHLCDTYDIDENRIVVQNRQDARHLILQNIEKNNVPYLEVSITIDTNKDRVDGYSYTLEDKYFDKVKEQVITKFGELEKDGSEGAEMWSPKEFQNAWIFIMRSGGKVVFNYSDMTDLVNAMKKLK